MSLVAYGNSDESDDSGCENDTAFRDIPQRQIGSGENGNTSSARTENVLTVKSEVKRAELHTTPSEGKTPIVDSSQRLDAAEVNGPLLKNTTGTTPSTQIKNMSKPEGKPVAFNRTAGIRGVNLPPSKLTSINFDVRILDKNRSQPIRINIPSLKELGKEEPAKKRKIVPSIKGCGLFDLLPPPKHVPRDAPEYLNPMSVVSHEKIMKKPTKSKGLSKSKKRNAKRTAVQDDAFDEDNETGEPIKSFFFSDCDDIPLLPTEVGIPIPDSVTAKTKFSDDHVKTETIDELTVMRRPAPLPAQEEPTYTQSFSEESPTLDSAALNKLCGAQERKKGPKLSEMIDISGSSLMGDSSLLLAKDLSKEQPTYSFKRKSDCSSLQRRKHQITYLAEQAKAQELELRNNWAQNRMTRKQTQAKYGF